MAVSHESGPTITYGPSPSPNPNINPIFGPSATYQGSCILDPRTTYRPGQDSRPGTVKGFLDTPYILMVDAVPTTMATANISALANAVSGTAVTLVSSSASGITVGNTIFDSNGNTVTGLLAIEQAYTPLTAGVMSCFDPTKAITRNVRITGVASGTGGHFIVKGYDIYGVPMSEDINATSGATTTSGKKAFKYIASVTPQFTDAHTYSVGTGDVFGINMRSTKWEYTNFYWNGAFVTVSTGWVTADVTVPATTTTGDIRGTYGVQSASDGSKRLAMFMSLQLSDITGATPVDASTLFGTTQV